MRIIATICARGGSKGLPGKNIKILEGKPLIAHTIEHALSCPKISEVYVSTDCGKIAEIAKAAGAKVPFLRPAALATSEAGKIPVIQHLSQWVQEHEEDFDVIVDLDPTSPLRNPQDILDCIALLSDDTDVVITAYPSDKNPYFNMVEVKPDGRVGKVKEGLDCVSRQTSPEVYAMNASIYVWHKHTLVKGLWDGKVKLHVMPRERSIDIDSPIDFKLVELLMKEREKVYVD